MYRTKFFILRLEEERREEMKKSVKKYEVSLNKDQKEFLVNLTRKGKNCARKIKRAIFFYLQMKVKEIRKYRK